jgi:hypothetical protein
MKDYMKQIENVETTLDDEDKKIDMKLIKCSSGSSVALPNSIYSPKYLSHLPCLSKTQKDFHVIHNFAKNMVADYDYIIDLLDTELLQLYSAIDYPEDPFITKAMEKTKERKNCFEEQQAIYKEKYRKYCFSDSEYVGKNKEKFNTSEAEDGMVYFYQAADGQHLFLHPLDIKICKTEYKAYHLFPDEISVCIKNVQESTMNDELRKRYKYLSHLPLSCDVSFVEIDYIHPELNICRKKESKDGLFC